MPHDQTQRGYAAPEGGLVIVQPDELAALTPQESRDIEFTRFVPIGAIDPQWYDRPYYLGPDDDNGAYSALTTALGRSNVEGVAHWVMRKKAYVGALRVYAGVLVLVSLRHEGEVVAVDSLETTSGPALDQKELAMAQQLMGMLEEDFDPTAYRDEYRERVLALVDSKARGKKTEARARQIEAAYRRPEGRAGREPRSTRQTEGESQCLGVSLGGTVDDEPQQPTCANGASFVRGFWSGNLSFGLVSIPVSLITAQRSNRVSLRMLAPDGTQLRRRFFCPNDNVALDNGDIVRGYEVEKDRFVVVTDEELEALVPKLSQEIDLTRFVPLADIDPMRFEHGYFLVPSKRAGKAYRLLAEVMEDRARAGIATFVMRGKQYLVAIIARGGLLRAYTLRFADELRSIADAQVDATSDRRRTRRDDVPTSHRGTARRRARSERPRRFTLARVARADREKAQGSARTSSRRRSIRKTNAVGAQIVDLMEYLKKSIGADAAEPTEKPKRPRSAKRKAETAQPKKPRRTRPT